VLEASTPTFAPERPVSPEEKVPVLPVLERDLEEVEAGGLVEEGKVNVQAITAKRIKADHTVRSNFFQLDDAIAWYQDASDSGGGVKRFTDANLEFRNDPSQTRTADRIAAGH
jgi:hypothetical protein